MTAEPLRTRLTAPIAGPAMAAEPLLTQLTAPIAELAERLRGLRVVALTGAGVSTESGIPDYRSPEALLRPRRTIHGPDFARSAQVRHRYWARAMVGWERFGRAQPGAAHHALARLEASGAIAGLITQNVDRLHHAAGSRRVIELHGALAEVVCLACGVVEERDAVQGRMRVVNGGWIDAAARAAPDGDADLDDEVTAAFAPPLCLACEGPLKPRVVFFGDNVPRPVVDEAFAMVDEAGALLVAGTSLAVFSGYRFLRRAAERGVPIVIVNRGPVRGEEHAALKIEAGTGATLEELARRLGPEPPSLSAESSRTSSA
jgi:NAD-dependent deacetylase sirtuin 4